MTHKYLCTTPTRPTTRPHRLGMKYWCNEPLYERLEWTKTYNEMESLMKEALKEDLDKKSSMKIKEIYKTVYTQKVDRYWPNLLVRTTELLITYGNCYSETKYNNNNNNAMENNEHINNETPKTPRKSNEHTPTQHAVRFWLSTPY